MKQKDLFKQLQVALAVSKVSLILKVFLKCDEKECLPNQIKSYLMGQTDTHLNLRTQT